MEAWARGGACKAEVRAAAAAAAPGALWGQTASAGGREADFGIACGGNELGAGGGTAAGDATAAIAGGRSGWRTGPGAGTGVAPEAGRWKA